jgi:hypothetical protein
MAYQCLTVGVVFLNKVHHETTFRRVQRLEQILTQIKATYLESIWMIDLPLTWLVVAEHRRHVPFHR